MRRIKQPLPPLQTAKEIFEQGQSRKLVLCLHETRMYLRAMGLKKWLVLDYGVAFQRAAAAQAGFDPAPNRRGRKP